MSERLDLQVRELIAELVESAPEAPPLPQVEPRRLVWVRWVAAGATAVIALVVGLAVFLPDGGDDAALPPTTMTGADTTEAAAETTMPSPERAAAIAALDEACMRFGDTGDRDRFREDVSVIVPPPGEATFFSAVDVQIARAIALAGRGDGAGVAEQLERIEAQLVGFGAGGCEGLDP
jgi:hypothetical protein